MTPAKYSELKAAGKCCYTTMCGQDAVPGKTLCLAHNRERAEYGQSRAGKKSHRKAHRKYCKALRELGVCRRCAKREVDSDVNDELCVECHGKRLGWNTAYRRSKGQQPTTKKCSLCREVGCRRDKCPKRFRLDEHFVPDIYEYATSRPGAGS